MRNAQGSTAVGRSEFDSLRYGLGSSINCLGRRVTSYTTRDPKEIAKLLEVVPSCGGRWSFKQ